MKAKTARDANDEILHDGDTVYTYSYYGSATGSRIRDYGTLTLNDLGEWQIEYDDTSVKIIEDFAKFKTIWKG